MSRIGKTLRKKENNYMMDRFSQKFEYNYVPAGGCRALWAAQLNLEWGHSFGSFQQLQRRTCTSQTLHSRSPPGRLLF